MPTRKQIEEAREHKIVKFIAIGLYYWGGGETREEAMAALRRAGFRYGAGKTSRVLVYDFGEGVEDAHVDAGGGVVWWTPEGQSDVPPRQYWIDRRGHIEPYSG